MSAPFESVPLTFESCVVGTHVENYKFEYGGPTECGGWCTKHNRHLDVCIRESIREIAGLRAMAKTLRESLSREMDVTSCLYRLPVFVGFDASGKMAMTREAKDLLPDLLEHLRKERADTTAKPTTVPA